MAEYAKEYNQSALQNLLGQYSNLLQPEVEKSMRAVKAQRFGQGLGTGSPYQAGLGEVQAQRLQNIGQYGMNLAQTGLGAARDERLLAEQRAYEDPYKQAELFGMFNGKQTLERQKFGELQRQFGIEQQNWGKQQELNQFNILANMLGQGYINPKSAQQMLGNSNYSPLLQGFQNQQQLAQTAYEQSPEYQDARRYGFASPNEQALYFSSPDLYKQMADRSKRTGSSFASKTYDDISTERDILNYMSMAY